MDELDYALETVDSTTFEQLSASFLRSLGYTVKESGVHGTDGGWDARVGINGRNGIAHASVRSDWRIKLREDAQKVAELEDQRGDEYDIFVFVTSQRVTGQQELDLEDEIEDKYGWKLKLYHRQNLLGNIHDCNPKLADRFLDINLAFDTDHLAELEKIRDKRLEAIQNREHEAAALTDQPTVVLQVIPNGVFSNRPVRSTVDLPNPPILGSFNTDYAQARGKSKYASDRSNSVDNRYSGYGFLRNDGLYESATTNLFDFVDNDLWVKNRHDSRGPCFDASILIAVCDSIAAQAEMGFSGTASVWITALDAAEAQLSHGHNLWHSLHDPPKFGFKQYTSEVATLSIGEHAYADIIPAMEPALSEFWLEFGYHSGCKLIEDGEWTGQGISVGDLQFP